MGEYLKWDGKKWIGDSQKLEYKHTSEAISDMVGWSPKRDIEEKIDNIEYLLEEIKRILESERD